MGQTINYKFPYPEKENDADVPFDLKRLADAIDSILKNLDNNKADTSVTDSINISVDEIRQLANLGLKNVTYNSSNGVMTFTANSGTQITIDLPLELIIESGTYNSGTKTIILTLANKDTIEIPIGDMLTDIYTKSEVDTKFSQLNVSITKIENELKAIEKSRVKRWGRRYYYGQSSSSLEALGDSIGLTARATFNGESVINDWDNEDIFKDIKEVKRDKLTHKLLSILGDSDYSEIDGEVMIDFPDTYWKFEESSDKTYLDIWLSNAPLSGYTKVDKFAVGKYSLSLASDGTTIQTKSGFPVEGWKGLTTWRNLVNTQYGEGACLLDWRYQVICNLYLIEFGDFNSQSKLGQRHSTYRYNFSTDKALIAENGVNRIVINTSGGNAFIVGQQIIIGTSDGGTQIAKYRTITSKENYSNGSITGIAIYFDGDPVNITTSCGVTSCGQNTGSCDRIQASSGCMHNDGKCAASYRGYETSSIYDWIDGTTIYNGNIFKCMDPKNYVSDKHDGEIYKMLSYKIPASGSNGYIKTLGFDKESPFAMFPKEIGGGSSTHITDYTWYNNSGTFAARVGGYVNNGADAGLFYWSLNYGSGIATWVCGARVLMYQL